MKTFEGSHIRGKFSEVDDWRAILPMYLLRAVSVTLILFLFSYIADRLMAVINSYVTFPEFALDNNLAFITMTLSLFLLQALFYAYQIKRKVSMRRSNGELIMGYVLPLIGIIATIYTAYAVGAM